MLARNVIALTYDGQCLFELGIAAELFGLARPELGRRWYEFRVVAIDDAPASTLGGLSLAAAADHSAIRTAGTIVVPGWRDRDEAPPSELLEALRDAHDHGARLVSICSGVYVLAAAGLLDGRPATTHWHHVEHLAARYPHIEVRRNVLFVDDGEILTSAGSAAGIDLGLHLIRRDHGAAVAAQVARRLVVPPQREGSQAQYVEHHAPPRAAGLAPMLDWIGEHLDEPIGVEEMARAAHMSPRTFARRFGSEVGVTPHRWLTRERVRRAQELLESTDRSVEEIATAVGFGSAETLRHHFRRQLATTPSAHRRTFGLSRHTA